MAALRQQCTSLLPGQQGWGVATLSGQCPRRKAPNLVRTGFLEEAAGQQSRRQAQLQVCVWGRQVRTPTFGSFQVPDADGARLGTGHNELLRGVETYALHWGRVTRQAL